MFTRLKIPSNKLLIGPYVNVDLEWSGKHHYALTSGAEDHYEKIVASILKDTMQEDAYSISLGDLYYLFFSQRSTSIGNTYSYDWECGLLVNPKSKKFEDKVSQKAVRCGTKNKGVLELSSIEIEEIPDDFEYPIRTVEHRPTKDQVKVYIRILSLAEEFEILDKFYDKGITYDELVAEHGSDYAWFKMIKGLEFQGAEYQSKVSALKADKVKEFKRSFLEEISFSSLNQLMADSLKLSTLGPKMNQAVPQKCSVCGGISLVRIPFSSDFIL